MLRKNRKFTHKNRSLGVDWSSKEERASYAREWRAATKSATPLAPKPPKLRPQHKFFAERPLQLCCHHCGQEKAFTADNFHRDKSCRFGLSTTCRVCRRKRKQAYADSLARKFGVTAAVYDAHVRNGKCHICGVNAAGMSLDHCHKTDTPRGVLCRACNTGIGCFKDSPALLEAAIAYLRTPR